MEQRSSLKEFARYTLLNVMGMIGLSCYILADTFFVSKGLGASGLAALNLAIPVYSFIHGSGLMLGVGGATKYSIFRAQGGQKEANRVFTNTLYAAIALAAVFFLAGVFLSGQITTALGADAEVFTMTQTYLRVIMLFAPAFIMNDVLICFVRNDGNPRLSMIAMLLGSLSNIILDYVFIFPFGMGIFGAVLATGMAPIFSMMVLSLHRKEKPKLKPERTKAQFGTIKTVFSLGIPSLITEVASGVVMIIFNVIILGLRGNIGVAAYGVIANLALVVVAIYTGIAQGMQPLISQAYGYGDTKKMKQILGYAVKTMLVLSAVIYAGVFTAAGPISDIFNSGNNAELKAIAIQGLRIYFIAMPFIGANVVLSMFFTSSERALPAQTVSLLRGMLLIVPMAFIMSTVAGLTGVWMTVPLTEGLVAVLAVAFYLRQAASNKRTLNVSAKSRTAAEQH